MARPKRRDIKFTEDSLNELFQELYNDTHIIRAKIVRLFTEWENRVKDNGEIAAIGDQIIKLITAEAKNQDAKISLLKILKEIVFNNKNNDSNKEENEDITDARRNELLDMVHSAMNKKK